MVYSCTIIDPNRDRYPPPCDRDNERHPELIRVTLQETEYKYGRYTPQKNQEQMHQTNSSCIITPRTTAVQNEVASITGCIFFKNIFMLVST